MDPTWLTPAFSVGLVSPTGPVSCLSKLCKSLKCSGMSPCLKAEISVLLRLSAHPAVVIYSLVLF